MHISLAYSPDTDDAFMVHALKNRLLSWGEYEFEFISKDIQELNVAAQEQRYDITAISIAAYPSMAYNYLLMPIGASIGDDFGPAIVVRQDSPVRHWSELKGQRIAVPGTLTSAFFAAKELLGSFTPVPMYFLDIAPAVRSGTVDGGILIHELQLICEQHGLTKVGDLGKIWHRKFKLPLPLGANAIRRSLGHPHIQRLTELYTASIKHGLNARTSTLEAVLPQAKATLELADGNRYIDMYVNRRSLRIDQDVRMAIDTLFAIGSKYDLCTPVTLTEHFLVGGS